MYYNAKYAVYDSLIQYINGNLNDVYFWKTPLPNSIEEKVIKKACELFYRKQGETIQ